MPRKQDIPPNSQPYRPCNGDEGLWFTGKWCDNCSKHPINYDAKNQCGILLRTFEYDIGDPEYPWQWRLLEGKTAVCLAFKDRKEAAILRSLERRKKPKPRKIPMTEYHDDKTIDMFTKST